MPVISERDPRFHDSKPEGFNAPNQGPGCSAEVELGLHPIWHVVLEKFGLGRRKSV